MSELIHNKEKRQFTLEVKGSTAKVDYTIRDGIMYLNYAEVPFHLRGGGVGRELVLKTFKKLTDEGYQAVAICGYIKSVARRSETWKTVIG